jgi:hypothetical protein
VKSICADRECSEREKHDPYASFFSSSLILGGVPEIPQISS